jgi:hypothetical protein
MAQVGVPQPRAGEVQGDGAESPVNSALARVLGSSVLNFGIECGSDQLTAAAKARKAVLSYLRYIVPEFVAVTRGDVPEDTELCVGELVGDAIEHSEGLTHVRMHVAPEELAVVVGSGRSKSGGTPVIRRNVAPDDEHGRGLRIVEELSTNMGFEPKVPTESDPTTMDTWFVMDLAETV